MPRAAREFREVGEPLRSAQPAAGEDLPAHEMGFRVRREQWHVTGLQISTQLDVESRTRVTRQPYRPLQSLLVELHGGPGRTIACVRRFNASPTGRGLQGAAAMRRLDPPIPSRSPDIVYLTSASLTPD